MKTKLFYALLLLLPLFATAQKAPRTILHGKVIADSLAVENLSVLNINSKIGAVTDENGRFTIYARATDTLFFSGISFRAARLVLNEADFLESQLIIKLDVDVKMLDEVVIKANTLTGQLDKDSKNTKTLSLNSGLDQETAMKLEKFPVSQQPVNGALPATESSLKGVDFIKVYRMFFKKKPTKKDKGEIYGTTDSKTFSDAVKERFTHHFFTQTLNIPHDQIGLFLAFCDNGKETAELLDPKNEFELTDYLVVKSKEYLKRSK